MDVMTSPIQAALLDRERVIQRGISAEVERLQKQQEDRWAECLRLLGDELGVELPSSTRVLQTEDRLYRIVWGEGEEPPPVTKEEEDSMAAQVLLSDVDRILEAEGLSERTLDPEPAAA